MAHKLGVRVSHVSIALLSLLLFASGARGQSGRGTVTGEVKDVSGSVVPGAEVVMTNKATGEEKRTVTTDTGLYRVPYVEPGTYKISVSLKNFKTATRDNVQVLLAQTVTADFTLELGEVSENITV